MQKPIRPTLANDMKRTQDQSKGATDEEDDEDQEKGSLKKYLLSLGRDILIAVIIMVIIIGGLYGYTGNWPPMVVIESDSMMHGDDSNVGTIDTGDLVLVKSIDNRKDITTYVEGQKKDYKTYDSYGDVIIFKKNGLDDTPVIHRAVVWIVYNASGYNNDPQLREFGSWDIPSLGLYNVTSFWIDNYQPNHFNLTVDLKVVLRNFQKAGVEPHDGFIIKGDNNLQVDQLSDLTDSERKPVRPIKTEWIVGKAQGELPWFGLIKLYISGETKNPNSEPPPTSVRMLVFSIALIIIIPIVLDILFSVFNKHFRKGKKDEEEEKDNSATGIDKSKGGGGQVNTVRPGDKGPPPYLKSTNNNRQPQQGLSKDELFKKIK